MKLDFFDRAIELAEGAATENEVPIAAIFVRENKIIAEAYNQTEVGGNFAAHAELLCLQQASQLLKTKYLNGGELYVTLEPCLMCQYAARLSRVESIYYLLPSEKYGSSGYAYPSIKIEKVTEKNYSEKSLNLLQSFFQKRR